MGFVSMVFVMCLWFVDFCCFGGEVTLDIWNLVVAECFFWWFLHVLGDLSFGLLVLWFFGFVC